MNSEKRLLTNFLIWLANRSETVILVKHYSDTSHKGLIDAYFDQYSEAVEIEKQLKPEITLLRGSDVHNYLFYFDRSAFVGIFREDNGQYLLILKNGSIVINLYTANNIYKMLEKMEVKQI